MLSMTQKRYDRQFKLAAARLSYGGENEVSRGKY